MNRPAVALQWAVLALKVVQPEREQGQAQAQGHALEPQPALELELVSPLSHLGGLPSAGRC